MADWDNEHIGNYLHMDNWVLTVSNSHLCTFAGILKQLVILPNKKGSVTSLGEYHPPHPPQKGQNYCLMRFIDGSWLIELFSSCLEAVEHYRRCVITQINETYFKNFWNWNKFIYACVYRHEYWLALKIEFCKFGINILRPILFIDILIFWCAFVFLKYGLLVLSGLMFHDLVPNFHLTLFLGL